MAMALPESPRPGWWGQVNQTRVQVTAAVQVTLTIHATSSAPIIEGHNVLDDQVHGLLYIFPSLS